MSLLAVVLAAAGSLCGGCCLARPADAKTLFDAGSGGWRTPEAAFETFRAAFSADLPELEFRSFSASFREREKLSYHTYLEARRKLIASQPFLGLLTRAKVDRSDRLDAGRHRLVVLAVGQRFVVDLVREDGFQIYAGADFLADGGVEFQRAVRVADAPGGVRVTAEVFVPAEDLAGAQLSGITELDVGERWKIDGFGEDSKLP